MTSKFFSSSQIHPFLNPRLNNLFIKHVWRPYRGLRSCDLTNWHTVVSQPITVAVRNGSSYTVPCPKRSNKKDLTVDSWVVLIKSVCLWKKVILASLVRKEKKEIPGEYYQHTGLISSHTRNRTFRISSGISYKAGHTVPAPQPCPMVFGQNRRCSKEHVEVVIQLKKQKTKKKNSQHLDDCLYHTVSLSAFCRSCHPQPPGAAILTCFDEAACEKGEKQQMVV